MINEKWSSATLATVCDIVNGSTPLRSKLEFWEDGDYPWFTIDDIREQGRYINYTKQLVTQAALKKLRIVPKDSVLLCCTASVGEYALTNIDLTTNQQFNGLVIKDKNKLLPKFLLYWCSDLKKTLLALSGKTTIDFVSISKLKNLSIPLPILSEQQQIVEKLETAFDLIDRAKANIEKNIQNAKELFQSKLNQVFSSGKDKISSKKWSEKFLNEISTNLDSKRVPITKSHRVPGTIPYYGASGIVDYVQDYIFDGKFLLISEDGANLVMRTYPIAFTAEGKSWVNNHAHILQFKDSCTHKFVEYYLNSIKLDDFISGMAQPKLNQAMLNKIPIYLPVSLDEQQKIVEQIDQLSTQTELLQQKYQQKLANLKELKKSILEKAFQGKLL